jgi:2-phospho-L-lactate guanylyltransferase
MARGVLNAARAAHGVGSVLVLSASRPEWWDGDWAAEQGAGGLNAHLETWRAGQAGAPCAIVHGDLPHVTSQEIEALLDCASQAGIAMATDHAGKGTNALAIADGRPFAFRFGVGSRARHCAQAPGMAVLQLPGLADDVDEPADLHLIA